LGEISLRANQITKLGAQHIASHIHKTNLRKLCLSHNSIGDEGAQYLAEALDGHNSNNMQTLEVLTLSSNGLGNKSVLAMATALTNNQRLKTLALDRNSRVDRRGASSFVQCLQQNKTLLDLAILENSYENHLLNDKLNFYLEVNKMCRQYMTDMLIPDATWPRILSAMERPDHLFLVLRERPDVVSNRM
jgi:Ran GTPase-activating protein (RanGAP) involved in mRNA processing and transport